ncbi:MAG: histidinol-phosphatase [Spirochaetes bacterium]|nr:histidinol-phosphatase [Spirochaetota bacterium]
MRFSYHTHCEYCDGKATAAEMAGAAAAAGYSILGFSSHAPLPFKTSWNMDWTDLRAYADVILGLKEKWGREGLQILLGLEVDYIPGLASPADEAYRVIPLDHVIGSVHYIVGLPGGAFTVDESAGVFERHLAKATGGDARPLWKEYYRAMIGMIEAGGFDIIGHFDLVKKNKSHAHGFDEEDSAYLDAAFEAADRAGELSCIAEINTGGIARGKTGSVYPSLTILKRMREAGVRLTIGDDAHAPCHLGSYQGKAIEAAATAGYKSLWYLGTDRSWKEIGLDEAALPAPRD